MVTVIVTIFLSFLRNTDYLQSDCCGVTGAKGKNLPRMEICAEVLRGDGGQWMAVGELALNCLDQIL